MPLFFPGGGGGLHFNGVSNPTPQPNKKPQPKQDLGSMLGNALLGLGKGVVDSYTGTAKTIGTAGHTFNAAGTAVGSMLSGQHGAQLAASKQHALDEINKTPFAPWFGKDVASTKQIGVNKQLAGIGGKTLENVMNVYTPKVGASLVTGGLKGGNLLSKAGHGVAEGARLGAIGGVAQAGQAGSSNPLDIARTVGSGAVIGGALGGAAPVAGAGAKVAYKGGKIAAKEAEGYAVRNADKLANVSAALAQNPSLASGVAGMHPGSLAGGIPAAGYQAGARARRFGKASDQGLSYKGADGQPRVPVSNEGAKLNVAAADGLRLQNRPTTLKELLPHKEFEKDYKPLRDIPVLPAKNDPGVKAVYDPARKAILVDPTQMPSDQAGWREVLLGERNHAIQDYEGHAQGTMPGETDPGNINPTADMQAIKVDMNRHQGVTLQRETLFKELRAKVDPKLPKKEYLAQIQKIHDKVYDDGYKYARSEYEDLKYQHDELKSQAAKDPERIAIANKYKNSLGEAEAHRDAESTLSQKQIDAQVKTGDFDLYHGLDPKQAEISFKPQMAAYAGQPRDGVGRFSGGKQGEQSKGYTVPDENSIKATDTYGMSHRPTKTGATADDISQAKSDMGFPRDFYEHPEYYAMMNEPADRESFAALKKIRSNPEAEVTIYRASPKGELNEGDWISLSKTYAKGESAVESTPVHAFKVKAKDIQFAGDSINEFGYWPTSKDAQRPVGDTPKKGFLGLNESGSSDLFTRMGPEGEKPKPNAEIDKLKLYQQDYMEQLKTAKTEKQRQFLRSKISQLERQITGKDTLTELKAAKPSPVKAKEITPPAPEPTIPSHNPGEYKVGQTVKALDRNNIGRVTGVRVDGSVTVAFKSKEGLKSSKTFTPDQLAQVASGKTDRVKELNDMSANRTVAEAQRVLDEAQGKPTDPSDPVFGQVPKGEGDSARKFAKRLVGDDTVPDTIKEGLNLGYNRKPNPVTIQRAADDIATRGVDTVANELRGLTGVPTDEQQAAGMLLMRHFIENDHIERATEIANKVARNATEAGRAVQIMATWRKTTPDGAFMEAVKIVNEANAKLPKGKQITLSAEKEAEIRKLAEAVQTKAPGSREHDVAVGLLKKSLMELAPVSFLRKLSTFQTIMQLLNFKTGGRNILGSVVLGSLENVSEFTAAGLETAIRSAGKLGGKDIQKTTVLPQLWAQTKGLAKGAAYGAIDVHKGIRTGGSTGVTEVQPAVFKNKILHGLEQALGYSLSVPDRAFFQAAYEGSIANQVKALKLEKPTAEVMEQATKEAMYRTFQNNSQIAKALSATKRGMNFGKDWGMGDLILKYPKVPGNILSVGLDYSPAGFVKSMAQFYQGTKNAGLSPAQQREAVMNLSRSVVGSGLIAGGAVLAANGIITATRSRDKDQAANDKASGKGPFSFNLDGLGRWLKGQDPKAKAGDLLVNYDWLQPTSIALSMGANLVLNHKDGQGLINDALQAMDSGTSTITGQPVLTGVQKFIDTTGGVNGQEGSISGAIGQAVGGAPASFIPSLLNQASQTTDNTARNQYSPDFVGGVANTIKAKLPSGTGVGRDTLPTRVNVDGTDAKQYDPATGGNNLFNVFLNPAFATRYKDSPVMHEVNRLFETTGETSQYPNVVKTKQKIDGKNVALSGDQVENYQRTLGTTSMQQLAKVVQDPTYKDSSDANKVKILSDALTDINAASKTKVFGGDPYKLDKSPEDIYNGMDYQVQARDDNGHIVKKLSTPKFKKPKAVSIRKGRIAKGKTPHVAKAKVAHLPKSKKIKVNTAPNSKLANALLEIGRKA